MRQNDTSMDDTFVIGDVHGHLDRLEALLKQEGFVVWCEYCQGSGTHTAVPYTPDGIVDEECEHCHGDGWRRDRKNVTIVQLGDLGHMGEENRTGDLLCYRFAYHGWIDIVLWGNHDRYAMDEHHAFRGCMKPNPETRHFMNALHRERRYRLAHEAHGFLLTHAGLALAFRDQKVPDHLKTDPWAFVDWINGEDYEFLVNSECDPQAVAIRDAVGHKRGGSSKVGGILWRDISEKLYPGFRQIFGHSADPRHELRYCWQNGYSRSKSVQYGSGLPSYCIDIGGKGDWPGESCLMGMYLPSEKIARVDLA